MGEEMKGQGKKKHKKRGKAALCTSVSLPLTRAPLLFND